MLELNSSKPALIALQLGSAWLIGAIALPAAGQFLAVAAFAGGAGPVALVALLAVSAALSFLLAVVCATRAVSTLGSTAFGRVLWALLVLGGGSLGWWLGWSVSDVAGLGLRDGLKLVLGGIPFALAAGLLLRGWKFRTTALGLSLALLVTGLAVLRPMSPEEFEDRLATKGIRPETAYVVAIPGYRPSDDRGYGDGLGGGGFFPQDPAAVSPDRFITITGYERLLAGEQMCGQPTAQDSRLSQGDCDVEPDGLVYRDNGLEHGYQVRTDQAYVTVVGTPGVDRDLLRIAARTLHLATAADVGDHQEQIGTFYAATVPGYVVQPVGAATASYQPAGYTGSGLSSVAITLYVQLVGTATVCFGTTECTSEGDDLTYFLRPDTHGYVARHGAVDVLVEGGLRADKSLLRQAAREARPATDEELRRVLPPAPADSFVEQVREWVRRF